jgi:CRP/FNR family transcriptional regulator, cyclic AMP receptor protein
VTATKTSASAHAGLLDLEPDLGEGIEASQWQDARRLSLVKVVRLGCGPLMLPQSLADRDDVVGLIVTDGLISRETAIGAPVAFELICQGDILLPPTGPPDHVCARAETRLTVLTATTLIVLGQSFIHAAARWPVLLSNLHRRLESQRQRLTAQGLAVHLPRAEDRLLLILWQLADGCGHVTPEGIVLPLSLSHEILARMCAARRPTITLAFGALQAADLIRRHDGHLVLTDAARQRADQLTNPDDVSPAIGAAITLHARRPHGNNHDGRPTPA